MPELAQRVPTAEIMPLIYGPDGRPAPRSLTPPGTGSLRDVGTPLAPIYDSGSPRGWDIPQGRNLSARPRSGQMTAFQTLRFLSDYDLIRLAINDIKGQIRGMEWDVAARKEFADQSETLQPQVDAVRAWIENPDPTAGLTFDDWLGSVLEDILVVDALSLYPQSTVGGDPLGLVQIDGATVVPIVDDLARPLLPPADAYQQFVQGRPERGFTLGELWYLPRNRRPNSPYGRSPVEDVLITVNLAIRTAAHELAYYTEGNTPDALYKLPASWSQQQVRDWQVYWDDVMSGRSGNRAGNLRFIPGGEGSGYQATKDHRVTYDQLEWLGRVIMAAFGVSPVALVQMVNRSTSETLETSTTEGGVRPMAGWIARVINRYVSQVLRVPEVEFVWADDEVEAPELVYQRNVAYVNAGILGRDEVRATIGQDPLEGEDGQALKVGPAVTTASGVVFLEDLVRGGAMMPEPGAGYPHPMTDGAQTPSAFAVGDRVSVKPGAEHDPAHKGAVATVRIVQGSTYGVEFDSMPSKVHKWYAAEELVAADGQVAALAPPGAEAKPPAEPAGEPMPAAKVAVPTVTPIVGPAADLARWRKVALKCVAAGRAVRPFVTASVSEFVQRRLVSRLAKVRTAADVSSVFALVKAGDPSPTGQADAQAALRGLISGWIVVHLPAIIANAQAVLAAATTAAEKLAKEVASAFHGVTIDDIDLTELFPGISDQLAFAAKAGAADAIASTGLDLDTPDPETLLFAQERAAELVGKKWVDGELVDNPDPKWSIAESMRADIQVKVSQAIDQGWSPQRLGAELRDSLGFARAETVARTETALAYGFGAQEAFADAGVELVQVLDGSGCLPGGHRIGAPKATGAEGTVEDENEANGQVWTLEQYRERTISHPNCVRAAVVYLTEKQAAAEVDAAAGAEA